MSVIVKGRSLPNNCDECFSGIYLHHGYYCLALCDWCDEKNLRSKPDKCPLIEIPEGARLIDAKRLLDKLHADNRKAFTKHDVWLMLMPYGSETVFEED